MDKLVKKVTYDLPNLPGQDVYMYDAADAETNRIMQKPLKKLYEYENQPDAREKIREYVSELKTEINRCENEISNTSDKDYEMRLMVKLETLSAVRDELLGLFDI